MEKEQKTVTITVRVRPSTKEALERLMERLDRSQAGVIEQLIRQADAQQKR
jgi:predicted transcriptional regulator